MSTTKALNDATTALKDAATDTDSDKLQPNQVRSIDININIPPNEEVKNMYTANYEMLKDAYPAEAVKFHRLFAEFAEVGFNKDTDTELLRTIVPLINNEQKTQTVQKKSLTLYLPFTSETNVSEEIRMTLYQKFFVIIYKENIALNNTVSGNNIMIIEGSDTFKFNNGKSIKIEYPSSRNVCKNKHDLCAYYLHDIFDEQDDNKKMVLLREFLSILEWEVKDSKYTVTSDYIKSKLDVMYSGSNNAKDDAIRQLIPLINTINNYRIKRIRSIRSQPFNNSNPLFKNIYDIINKITYHDNNTQNDTPKVSQLETEIMRIYLNKEDQKANEPLSASASPASRPAGPSSVTEKTGGYIEKKHTKLMSIPNSGSLKKWSNGILAGLNVAPPFTVYGGGPYGLNVDFKKSIAKMWEYYSGLIDSLMNLLANKGMKLSDTAKLKLGSLMTTGKETFRELENLMPEIEKAIRVIPEYANDNNTRSSKEDLDLNEIKKMNETYKTKLPALIDKATNFEEHSLRMIQKMIDSLKGKQ